jgi:hypothetical protein
MLKSSAKSAWSLTSDSVLSKSASPVSAKGPEKLPLGDVTNRPVFHSETANSVNAALQQDTENIIKQQMKKMTYYCKPGVLSRVSGMTSETAYQESEGRLDRPRLVYESHSLIYRSEVRVFYFRVFYWTPASGGFQIGAQ